MSIFNHNIGISIFGESHGEMMGITIHHFPSGITIDETQIADDLRKRHQFSLATSARREANEFKIISGYFNGYSTGAPLCVICYNRDIDSSWYEKHQDVVRPSHSDYTAYMRYQGFHDYRGGGHLSGRLTALFIIAGSICRQALKKRNIVVFSRIASLQHIVDDSHMQDTPYDDEAFPVQDPIIKAKMLTFLENLQDDSVGGVIQTKAIGVASGLGNPIFDNVESLLSHLIFAIPGVKGVSFGDGFAITTKKGSEANDEMQIVNGKATFLSNHSGGIQGGITNGNSIVFQTAIKPTPSIPQKQNTINIKTKENVTLVIDGRHDKQIVTKAIHVINAMTYICLFDLQMEPKL